MSTSPDDTRMSDSSAFDALDFSFLAFELAGWRDIDRVPDIMADSENPPRALFDVILATAKTIIDDTGTLRSSWINMSRDEKDPLEQRVRQLCRALNMLDTCEQAFAHTQRSPISIDVRLPHTLLEPAHSKILEELYAIATSLFGTASYSNSWSRMSKQAKKDKQAQVENLLAQLPKLSPAPSDDAWRKAELRPFIPTDSATVFFDRIREVGNEEVQAVDHYARILPITQSSGSGKTRLMSEATREFFSFQLFLRPITDKGANGYPPGDELPHAYLCTHHRRHVPLTIPEEDSRVYLVIRYFTALVQQAIADIYDHPELKKPAMWSELLRDFEEKRPGEKSARKIFFERVHDRATEWEHAPSDYTAAKNDFKNSMRQLSALIEGVASNPPVILFQLDEAHELQTGVGTAAVGSAMADLLYGMQPVPHLLVVSSTDPKLSLLPPKLERQSNAPSSRYIARSGTLPQPYTFLAYNAFLPAFLKDFGPSLSDLACLRSAHFATRIGRPMWAAYWDVSPDDDGSKMSILSDLAMTKLLGSTENSLRAALCCRLALGFSRAQNSHRLRDALVRHHMALALYVPQTCAYVMATYAAEPFLAAGAFRIMSSNFASMVDELIDLTLLSMIDRGLRGELMSKVMCMMAFDDCSRNAARPASKEAIRLFAPVSLEDFLGALTEHHPHLDTIWSDKQYGSKPTAARADETLHEYRGYTCVLGQWITADEIVPSYDTRRLSSDNALLYLLKQAIILQCGIQCAPDNPLVDLWIPFAHGTHVIALAIKSKNRQTAYADNEHNRGSLSRSSFQALRENGIPVIYLVHDIDDYHVNRPVDFRTEQIDPPLTRRADKVKDWAPLHHFVVGGLPSSIEAEKWSMLLHAQCNSFSDSGCLTREHLLQLLPTISRDQDVMQRLYGTDIMELPGPSAVAPDEI